jgi:hypothetical protein
MTASPNNTIVTAGLATITDKFGNVWGITTLGQVSVNGVPDQTSAHVVTLAYENGEVWQMNASRLWWGKTSPTAAWSPAYGTSVSPLVGVASTNNTVIFGMPIAGEYLDSPVSRMPMGITTRSPRADR